jgi:hypothetical protein
VNKIHMRQSNLLELRGVLNEEVVVHVYRDEE